jgi:hypothetical protein
MAKKKAEEPKKDDKKKEKPAKEEEPKDAGPSDPTKIPKILFLLGMIVFLLSTCASNRHDILDAEARADVAYLQGTSRMPVTPVGTYKSESKIKESPAYKQWEADFEEWRKWVHDHQEDLAYAKRTEGSRSIKRASKGWLRFYFAELGVILMTIGLALIMMKGETWERAAAILALAFGILPRMMFTVT